MPALDTKSKASIRRHLGVQFAGIGTLGLTFGIRGVIASVNQLEVYMNALQIPEYSLLMGVPAASIYINYGVQAGQEITITVGNVTPPTVYTYTVSPADMATAAPQQTVATNIASALNQLLPGILCSSSQMIEPLVAPQNLPPSSEIAMLAVNGQTFTLTATGSTAFVLYDGTTYPDPTYTVSDGNGDPTQAVVVHGLLPVCDALESNLLNASQYLSYSQVGSTATGQVVFRREELLVRSSLLNKYRREMAVMLSFVPGSYPNFGPRSRA